MRSYLDAYFITQNRLKELSMKIKLKSVFLFFNYLKIHVYSILYIICVGAQE